MSENENRIDYPPQPNLEPIKPERAFEILFPDFPFTNLPAFNIRNTPQFIGELFTQTYLQGSPLLKAKNEKISYTRRIKFSPFLDQITIQALLIPASLPFAVLPKPDEIQDLFDPHEEEIGGGITHLFHAPNPKRLALPSLDTVLYSKLEPSIISVSANIIGIEDKFDHRPTGLLIYLPGPRNPKTQRGRLFAIGKPDLIPVRS